MADNAQFEILFRVLKRFQESGILKELMLIGSWCLYFYQRSLKDASSLPALKTLDVDFLIPRISGITRETDIPELLKSEGFIPTFNRANGMVKYGHPELQVEFLVPELGRGGTEPREIPKLHIKAQPLRYLNFLSEHPLLLLYQGLNLRVPEPAAFALHKLIISQRRKKEAKAERDLEMAVGLLTILFEEKPQRERVLSILENLPEKWAAKILSVSKVHFPALNEAQRKNRA